ncbi:hypothetical protein [Massilibacteroides sp.]|uniref:hypothetical protein n=1 Tax=Massilibacteroides sp. TaxID=2034766 RepID=UPI0026170F7B|nr:hypothetical protein [Massilibacteroides sp.]MDD4514533.1 hypothetical protein [Massilibacteroides sp.]
MKVINGICLLMIGAVTSVSAQNVMTSSPYSMFGIGEISTGIYGSNVGMGSVAYGMRGKALLNIDNPAALTGLDSIRLIAETSGFLKNEYISSNGASNRTFTGNVSSFTMGSRIVPFWYLAVGLKPYSSMGYYFKSEQPLEGAPGSYYESTFEGSGGLSKLHLSNAFSLPYGFSVGINTSYIFGNLNQSETQSSTSVSQTQYVQQFYADFGAQYQRRLSKNHTLTLGAVYGYKQKIKLDGTKLITTSLSETESSVKNTTQYLPAFYGIGAALQYKKLTHALDYTFQEYSVLTSTDSRIKFRDTHELRYGISYDPEGFSSEPFWKRTSYKAGLSVGTPYMKVKGNSGIDWRATLGLGFPVNAGRITTSFYYEQMNLNNNALSRRVFGFVISYTLSERLFRVKL